MLDKSVVSSDTDFWLQTLQSADLKLSTNTRNFLEHLLAHSFISEISNSWGARAPRYHRCCCLYSRARRFLHVWIGTSYLQSSTIIVVSLMSTAFSTSVAGIFVVSNSLRGLVLWNRSAWPLFLFKQGINSRMKMIIEGMRPNPVNIKDGRTWCNVRGLFPWTLLLFQKASSKCLRKCGKAVKSFSTFCLIPVSTNAEIATSKTCWNVI